MEFSPLELVNIIEENSKMIKGFEIIINPMSEFELKYLKDLEILDMSYFHLMIMKVLQILVY